MKETYRSGLLIRLGARILNMAATRMTYPIDWETWQEWHRCPHCLYSHRLTLGQLYIYQSSRDNKYYLTFRCAHRGCGRLNLITESTLNEIQVRAVSSRIRSITWEELGERYMAFDANQVLRRMHLV